MHVDAGVSDTGMLVHVDAHVRQSVHMEFKCADFVSQLVILVVLNSNSALQHQARATTGPEEL